LSILTSNHVAYPVIGYSNKESKSQNLIVFGIPRGGIIVGDIVATKLKSGFDIVIPRKLNTK
jgi:predicted phosphoribosyltransferase